MKTRSRASIAETEKSLAYRLALTRKDFGWNQIELEMKSGISRGYISKLESGTKKNPTIHVIKSLAKALGVSTKYLMGEVDDPLEGIADDADTELLSPQSEQTVISSTTNQLVRRFVALFAKLSERDQSILLRMAETMAGADQPHIVGEEREDDSP